MERLAGAEERGMPEASESGRELVALARARLADELRALASLDPAELRARLLKTEPETWASRGALVHYIRMAADAGRQEDAQALFVALTRRIEGLTRKWIRRTVLSAGLTLAADEWREHASDLAQEQTLRLWDVITRGEDQAWELFFGRALAFAQGHIADAWLRRVRPRAAGRLAPPPLSLSRLLIDGEGALEAAELTLARATGDSERLSLAELADLRALVGRLPERERVAVVLRFWASASEDTIAEALGGVSTRAVRYTLKRAYKRLRAWYDGAAPSEGEEPSHGG
jgi:RNA polymerase sigma factor (sigma-70 family)